MERRKSLELHLTEAELETLINAVRSASDGRLPGLAASQQYRRRDCPDHTVRKAFIQSKVPLLHDRRE